MNGKKFFVILALFLFALRGITAQEAGPVFHRLSWQPVDYASGYEVVVEILAVSNEWVEQFRRTVETGTFVDCPLFVGKYRFRVSALDLLGRPGPATEWVYFELRTREMPETAETAKAPEAAETPEVPETAKTPAAPAAPAAGSADQSPPAFAVVPEEGGLSRFTLGLFYAPIITLPFSDFNEIYSTAPFQGVGFAAYAGVYPFTNDALGLGVSAFWNFLTTEIHTKSRYTHIAGGHLFAAWRIRPGKGIAVNIRAGGGVSYISSRFDFNGGLDMTDQAAWNPSLSAGVSLQGRLSGSLFLEAGIEYFHIFSKDNLMLNYLRPMIGIGWWL
ncbi:MAG: hypothetical protein LBC31_06110 [Treponema sp.]|jgi:hypothetical protein|nr:hypothetical protein [Treponema sp.]